MAANPTSSAQFSLFLATLPPHQDVFLRDVAQALRWTTNSFEHFQLVPANYIPAPLPGAPNFAALTRQMQDTVLQNLRNRFEKQAATVQQWMAVNALLFVPCNSRIGFIRLVCATHKSKMRAFDTLFGMLAALATTLNVQELTNANLPVLQPRIAGAGVNLAQASQWAIDAINTPSVRQAHTTILTQLNPAWNIAPAPRVTSVVFLTGFDFWGFAGFDTAYILFDPMVQRLGAIDLAMYHSFVRLCVAVVAFHEATHSEVRQCAGDHNFSTISAGGRIRESGFHAERLVFGLHGFDSTNVLSLVQENRHQPQVIDAVIASFAPPYPPFPPGLHYPADFVRPDWCFAFRTNNKK